MKVPLLLTLSDDIVELLTTGVYILIDLISFTSNNGMKVLQACNKATNLKRSGCVMCYVVTYCIVYALYIHGMVVVSTVQPY